MKIDNLPTETRAKEVADLKQLHHLNFSPVLARSPDIVSLSSSAVLPGILEANTTVPHAETHFCSPK